MPALSSIDGLSSGLNTTQIIDALIKAERQPAVLMEQEEADKTNIITALQALQAKIVGLGSIATQLSQRTALQKFLVNVSDDKYLTAKSDGEVSVGSYDIQVQSIARNNQLASQGYADQSQAVLGAGSISIGVGTGSVRTITIDSSNNSLVGVARAINDAKIGVSASVINDGSSSNPYRLMLTGSKTGLANKISITSSLSGLNNLNFTTAVFDAPEKISRSSASTSTVSLGASASYTGTTNKTYTFTVAGTGSRTIGTDNVTLNWSDGTNSGSILVTQADTEVELVGTGANGLKLSFSSGITYGGDSFQVATFAPVLQEAADAKIAFGSSGSGGSPITITSQTNTFKNVVSGLTIDVKKPTDVGTSVSLTTDIDATGIRDTIGQFIKQYNDINDYIKKQNTYNKDTKESGALFGEYTLDTIQGAMRTALTSRLSGLNSQYNQLAMLGIRTTTDGSLTIKDSSRLDTAIRTDLSAVINVFSSSGQSSSDNIRLISSSAKNKTGTKFAVDITQAATHGQFAGSATANPSITPIVLGSTNNRLKLSVDGLESDEIVLSEKSYVSSSELVTELQDRIDADAKIGNRGLKVSWEDTSSGMGRLVFTSSTYGTASKINTIASVSNSALTSLGLATGTSMVGNDVAGTINGEAATGRGQILTGNEKNATTSGLKLLVTSTRDQVVAGSDGTITLVKGVGAKMNDLISSYSASGQGLMDRRIKSYQGQVDDLKARVVDFDKRLEARRTSLKTQFYAMEKALANYNSIGTYLSGQVASMNSNWNFNSSNNG